MTIKVDTTSGTVQVDISGSYGAEQLLELVKRLAAARAQVAKDPAQPGEIWVAPMASCHAQLMGQHGPDSLLAFKFPGLGWIGATLGTPTRAQLISLLATQQSVVAVSAATTPAPAEPTLNIEPGPGGNTLH